MKRNILILFLFTIICFFSFADTRTALIIGNSSYESSPLINPQNDARDMAESLGGLGFNVTLKIDCSMDEIISAIRDFGDALLGGGVGLFYYSGHAVQVNGRNYLIPVDSNIQREDEIEFSAVDVGLVLNKMTSAKNELNIVILDSCRDNPFTGSFRSMDRGLSIVAAPSETLIVYATAPGSVASDGNDRNGTFTKHLLDYISLPGLEVGDMLRYVKRGVSDETNGMQRPWSTDDLTREFYFAGEEGNPEDYAILFPTNTDSIISTVPEGFVLVSGGTFDMGSNAVSNDERPVHSVTVNSFYMGKYEVTFEQYDEFCEDTGRSKPSDRGWGRGMRPVFNVSWYDTVEYCNWLSIKQGLTPCYIGSGKNISCNFNADGYRLPTEAEWEYAARSGGKDHLYSWGNGSPDGNIADESAKREYPGWTVWEGYDDGYIYNAPVGSFNGNDLGLYDMAGNVWEFCWDWYVSDYYSVSPATNPKGPSNSTDRVGRGGGWLFNTNGLRCSDRSYFAPDSGYDDVGFRLVRTK